MARPTGAVIAALLRNKAELGRQQLATSLREAAKAARASAEKPHLPPPQPIKTTLPDQAQAKLAGTPAARVAPPPAKIAPSSPPTRQAQAATPPVTPLPSRTVPIPITRAKPAPTSTKATPPTGRQTTHPPSLPAKQAPRQPAKQDQLLREAQVTFFLSLVCWLALIASAGKCTWFGVPLAIYSLWRGNKLRQHVRQDVAREGNKAFVISILFLVVAFFVIVAQVAG